MPSVVDGLGPPRKRPPSLARLEVRGAGPIGALGIRSSQAVSLFSTAGRWPKLIEEFREEVLLGLGARRLVSSPRFQFHQISEHDKSSHPREGHPERRCSVLATGGRGGADRLNAKIVLYYNRAPRGLKGERNWPQSGIGAPRWRPRSDKDEGGGGGARFRPCFPSSL